MIINLSEDVRLVKDEYNIVIQQFKTIKTKDKKTKEVVSSRQDWVTIPNFYTSSIQRAVKKCVQLKLINEEFESLQEYLEKFEETLDNFVKKIDVEV